MVEDLCDFGEEAEFWEKASSTCKEQRKVSPIALRKPQHATITKFLLGAFLL